MANSDLPHPNAPGHGDEPSASNAPLTGQSRLERILTKGSLWKKNTLRYIERTQEFEVSEANTRQCDTDNTARMFIQLSDQLDARNLEIERLQHAISRLEYEKSQLDRSYQRQVELHRVELTRLQDAYHQFEKESDSLLSELGEQNERLLIECRTKTVDRY